MSTCDNKRKKLDIEDIRARTKKAKLAKEEAALAYRLECKEKSKMAAHSLIDIINQAIVDKAAQGDDKVTVHLYSEGLTVLECDTIVTYIEEVNDMIFEAFDKFIVFCKHYPQTGWCISWDE